MAAFQEPSAAGGDDGGDRRNPTMLRQPDRRLAPPRAPADQEGAHPEVTSAVERRVVPWMVLAHRGPTPPRAEANGPAPARDAVARLAGLSRCNDLAGAVALLEAELDAGAALDALYLDLVAPAAVLLGQMWHEDTASIAEVTVGLACLQRLVHAFGPAFHQDDLRPDPRRRILLAPLPGEQHSFALVLVAEFLRRAGWDADNGRVLSCAALCEVLRREWFALAGLSVSCTTRLDTIAATIHALRQASRNRGIGIMVGGPLFTEHPDYVALVGADAMAVDARHAVVQADALVGLMAGRA